MIKQFWLNLPVKDIKKSKDFFSKLGFQFNSQYGNTDTSAALLVGEKKVVVMLFEEPAFKGFANNDIADTSRGTEVLLSIDAQSKEEVDEMAQKAVNAGGTSQHKPGEMQGWMYGCIFTDIDGHRWNVLYMDMSKMPRS
jgi:predicted lactoylglutathione lyase